MEGGGDNSNMILAKAHIPLYFRFVVVGIPWVGMDGFQYPLAEENFKPHYKSLPPYLQICFQGEVSTHLKIWKPHAL